MRIKIKRARAKQSHDRGIDKAISDSAIQLVKAQGTLKPRLLIVDHDVRAFIMHRLELAQFLHKAGYEVHVALPHDPQLNAVSTECFAVHGYFLSRQSTQPSNEMRCFYALYTLYRKIQPALVHHFGLKPVLYGGCAARVAGIPAAVSTFTGLGYLFRANTRSAWFLTKLVSGGLKFSFAHQNCKVIVQNLDDLKSLFQNGVAIAHKASLIKGSGVNISVFIPQPEPAGVPVIMMAARLIWEKGVKEFVEVARILQARGAQARFLLVGEPDSNHPSAVPLKQLEYWHACGYVEWVGWSYNMPELMKQCHVFCLPSYYGEGVPCVLLEAAATGRPIITTDSVGCRDVVRHGHNGLIVPAKDVAALAEAINYLIDDSQLRSLMGKRSRKIINKEFSLNQVIKENKAIYTSLLKVS